ncbi:MAG: SurA N-terminal domain-containing protein [Hyphomicrobiales bacterium]
MVISKSDWFRPSRPSRPSWPSWRWSQRLTIVSWPGAGAAVFAMVLSLATGWSGPAMAQASLAAVVNDEPISVYDVDQRLKFYQITGAKGGKAALKKRALKEVVDEALMKQEAKRMSIKVEDREILASINAQLKSNKRDFKWFKNYLKSRGVSIKTLQSRLRAQIAWRRVVQRTFRNQVQIGEADIEAAASKLKIPDASKDQVFSLRRIELKFAKGASEETVSRRLADAAKIRDSFRNCGRLNSILKPFSKVKVETLDKATPKSLKEPLRSLVANAKAGDIIPPDITDRAVVLVAVCSRSAASDKRKIVQRQLLNQEFSMLSDRHLRDLKQDALIEYR